MRSDPIARSKNRSTVITCAANGAKSGSAGPPRVFHLAMIARRSAAGAAMESMASLRVATRWPSCRTMRSAISLAADRSRSGAPGAGRYFVDRLEVYAGERTAPLAGEEPFRFKELCALPPLQGFRLRRGLQHDPPLE